MNAPNEWRGWRQLGDFNKNGLERRDAPKDGKTHYSNDEGKTWHPLGYLTKEGIEERTIPSYYRMPSGIEVKEISRHLSSNGGQAVQYIARATRIDGEVKGDPIKDLQKARDMIDDEIKRLKENKN